MKYRYYFKSGNRFFQSIRRYGNDPPKAFRMKGMTEENRYFMKKQEEEIKKLREQIQCLESRQQNLQDQLEKANEVLEKICNSKDCEKKK